MMSLRRPTAVALLLGFLLAAVPSRHVPGAEQAALLLRDGRLLFVNLSGAAIVGEVRLTPVGAGETVGSIAAAASGEQLFATVLNRTRDTTRLLAVRTLDHSVRVLASIADSVGYPRIEVGPVTGRLYLMANAQLHVVIVDSRSGRELSRHHLPRDASRDWVIYATHVSADERRLYVSYHGTSSTGIDWLTIDRAGIRSCDRTLARFPTNGCIETHGNFAVLREGIIAATGDAVTTFDSAGSPIERFAVGLPMTHFMDFAIDPTQTRVFALGSCKYTPGLTSLSLVGDPTPSRLVPRDDRVCGGAILVSPDGKLLLLSRDHLLPDIGPGEITIIDVETASVVRRIPVEATILAMAIIPR